MSPFTIKKPLQKIKIIAIGIGPNSVIIIEQIRKKNSYGIETIVVKELPRCVDEMRETLKDADLVFFTMMSNDLTKVLLSSILEIIDWTEAQTIFIMPKSFSFENKEQHKISKIRLSELEEKCDAILTPSINLLQRPIRAQTIIKTLSDITVQIIEVICSVVVSIGKNDITLDLNNLRVVLKGLSVVGTGECVGEKSAFKAMTIAMNGPSFNDMTMLGSNGILVRFYMHPSFPIMELNDAMDVIENVVHEDTNIVFGTTTDETLPLGFMNVVVIASLFKEEFQAVNNLK